MLNELEPAKLRLLVTKDNEAPPMYVIQKRYWLLGWQPIYHTLDEHRANEAFDNYRLYGTINKVIKQE